MSKNFDSSARAAFRVLLTGYKYSSSELESEWVSGRRLFLLVRALNYLQTYRVQPMFVIGYDTDTKFLGALDGLVGNSSLYIISAVRLGLKIFGELGLCCIVSNACACVFQFSKYFSNTRPSLLEQQCTLTSIISNSSRCSKHFKIG